MVRINPVKVSNAAEFPVAIQSTEYPLTVTWKVGKGTASYELTDGVGGRLFQAKEIRNEGSMKINNSDVNRIFVRLVGDEMLPAEFELSQNYPNPFNPATIIRYDLPLTTHVMLKVFNVLGQEVATLMNDVEEAGHKSVQFDASRLSSGTYFYRLWAGGFTSVRKLLILK